MNALLGTNYSINQRSKIYIAFGFIIIFRSFNLRHIMKEYFLKVKYISENTMHTKYTQLNGTANDLISYDDIVKAICNDTNYSEQNISHYTDKDGYIITNQYLENIVSQFIRCSCFELNVHIRATTIQHNYLPNRPVAVENPPIIITNNTNANDRSFVSVSKEVRN